MVINFSTAKTQIKRLNDFQKKLDFLDEVLESTPQPDPISNYEFSVINKEMQYIQIKNRKKREISLDLLEKLKEKSIKIRYAECVKIVELFIIGNKKVNRKKLEKYLKLKENAKKVEK